MIYEVYNINSKYYKQMMDVIIAAKVNIPEKGQVHHIIPRCWFKHYHLEIDNSISNTVLLTYEDHKLVHSLAYKCAKESWLKSKLAYACHMFGDMEPIIIVSEETKRKISESHKGKDSGYHEGMKGKKHTDEYKKMLSEARKGRKKTEEHKRKLSEAMKGRTFSEETRRKLSESHKGKSSGMKGKHHSEETKRKIRESLMRNS